MQLRHFTLGQGDNLDAGQLEPLVQAGDILLIPRQAVECLGQHDVEAAVARRRQQRLVAGP